MSGALSVRTADHPPGPGAGEATPWAVATVDGTVAGHARCGPDGALTLLLDSGRPDAPEVAGALVAHLEAQEGTTARQWFARDLGPLKRPWPPASASSRSASSGRCRCPSPSAPVRAT